METEKPILVQIRTIDELMLPGLLYRAKNSSKAAIHLHGNGSSSVFYHNGQRDIMARALNNKGISLLLFNNRGAHYIKKLYGITGKRKKKSRRFGMAYEKIKDCIQDIDGAISYLKRIGYREFYLIGESTGANKICVYHYYKPKNEVSKYILLGAGDDAGFYYKAYGKEKFFKLLRVSKEKISKRQGNEIITDLLPEEIFSYRGFYDIANPDGDYNVFPFLEVM
ncbi:DUF1749 domain-containing protein, partial [Patescibacteria group bacterium AH-259-L07]|nr:DUF1749 domain-containing protein [Patescibacteria group bacterium AH-259-L07]